MLCFFFPVCIKILIWRDTSLVCDVAFWYQFAADIRKGVFADIEWSLSIHVSVVTLDIYVIQMYSEDEITHCWSSEGGMLVTWDFGGLLVPPHYARKQITYLKHSWGRLFPAIVCRNRQLSLSNLYLTDFSTQFSKEWHTVLCVPPLSTAFIIFLV